MAANGYTPKNQGRVSKGKSTGGQFTRKTDGKNAPNTKAAVVPNRPEYVAQRRSVSDNAVSLRTRLVTAFQNGVMRKKLTQAISKRVSQLSRPTQLRTMRTLALSNAALAGNAGAQASVSRMVGRPIDWSR